MPSLQLLRESGAMHSITRLERQIVTAESPMRYPLFEMHRKTAAEKCPNMATGIATRLDFSSLINLPDSIPYTNLHEQLALLFSANC